MLPQLGALLLLPAVSAVFRDEVGHLDYHHELLGIPQRDATFFHRPRRDDKASLLYTLSDVGVLGAVNPGSGAVLWRQLLGSNSSTSGFVRVGEGEGWIGSALGGSVHAWDAVSGRNTFWADFAGDARDLEIMEMTETERKDVLALHDEGGGVAVVRRINSVDGSVVWEFRDASGNLPLQVSTNVEKVFLVSLHGSPASYGLRVSVLDTRTGARLDDIVVGSKGDVQTPADVMFVGANSAAPLVVWTDAARTKLRVNVLGTKAKQEFPLAPDTVEVEVHAPHLVQSMPHFLVHTRTKTGNRADVYHVDLKSNAVAKAYELPHLPGAGAFSTTSSNSNVFFTRITDDEVLLTASTSHGILGRWPLKQDNGRAVHAVSEVIKKDETTFAVRSATTTEAGDWVLIRNGEVAWTRPEGLTGGVAAAFAEIPRGEELAKSLEQEAHSNPLSAYVHRVRRHVNDLEHLPEYLQSLPQRLLSSVLGTDIAAKSEKPVRDSFGFHKLVIMATRRGRLYGLDAGAGGRILWTTQAFDISSGDAWDVKGLSVDDHSGRATVRGSHGEHIIVETDTGVILDSAPRGSKPSVQSTALVDSALGTWLLPVGLGGKIGAVPAVRAPQSTVVVRGAAGELKGLTFVSEESEEASEATSWVFAPPPNQKIVSVATRPSHDPIASIGRVLGDRSVKYKYLNPNTIVVAAADAAASTLAVYLLDTVSGEILSAATHEGIDTAQPVECAMAENWFLCTFFGRYATRDEPAQSLMGHQLVVSDLYESDQPNDRGPLGDAANFSSVHPVDVPVELALPSVVSQSFVLGAPLSALRVSQTRQGISTRQLLAYLPDTHAIIGLPRPLLEPRRPVGRDPTPAEVEEGLFRYAPAIEMDPKLVVTHQRDVVGVREIVASPAVVESTSLVFAYGIDVFGTRVAPSLSFDILGKGFNKVSLLGTVAALSIGVLLLGPLVLRKQINSLWKAPN